MALSDVYKLVVVQGYNAQRIVNVLHYSVQVDPTNASSASNLSQAFNTNVMPSWKALVTTFVTFETMEITKVDPAGEATEIFDFPDATTGNRVGDDMPQNVSLSLTKRTAKIGRRGHGRIAIAGLLVADDLEGQWTAATLTLADALATALVAPLSFGGAGVQYSPCLWSKTGGATPAARTTLITSILSQRTVRTQRSRTIGVGR